MKQLILASQSPRRKQLLHECGFRFQVDLVNVSEIIKENLSIDEAVSDLARQKSEAFCEANKHLKSQDILALSADTVVVFGDQIIGKPKNMSEACEFLTRLSGGKHEVKTAFCLYDFKTGDRFVQCETTQIWFKTLSEEEIINYVNTGEPMDKAGAYGIQGKGGEFVEKIEGSFSNVVGLPMEALEEFIKSKGWTVERV